MIGDATARTEGCVDGSIGKYLGSALVVSVVVFLGMLGTNERLSVVWDECYTLLRLARVRLWFEAIGDPARFASTWTGVDARPLEDRMLVPRAGELDRRPELFSARVLRWFWPFAREEPHGHPPFYAIVALLGDVVAESAPELMRARLGSMLFFAVAAGVLYWASARKWGWWAGLGAAAAWSLHPHLFALGHYATYDGLLASLWIIGTVAFGVSVAEGEASTRFARVGRWASVAVFGVILGCLMATKLTGWLLPVPLLGWVLLYRDGRGVVVLLVGLVVGLVVMYLLTPPFWADPVGGLVGFFRSNLGRSETIPIRTMFLGRVYETPTGSLPWYNTLVLMGISTPVGFLLLGAVGVFGVFQEARRDRAGVLFLLSAGFIFVLRAMPHTPGHDGVRQIAAAFGGLAALSGLGASRVVARWGRIGKGVVFAAVVEGLLSVAAMMPVPLSYSSPLVGGLPGATWLGMEPTYYWDGMTPEVFDAINERTAAGKTVVFVANPVAWYYREDQQLRAGLWPYDGRDYANVVVQNRPGSMSEETRAIVRRFGSESKYVVMSKFGVPLIWVFPRSVLEDGLRGGGMDDLGGRK